MRKLNSLQYLKCLNIFIVWCLLTFLLFIPVASLYAKPSIGELEQSVVRILTTDSNGKKIIGTGTGFLINNDGVIVTNWHVVAGAARAFVVFSGETRLDHVTTETAFIDKLSKLELGASLVKKLPNLDLAILKIRPPNKPPVKLSRATLKKGEAVRVIGFPGLADAHGAPVFEASSTSGEISRVFTGQWVKSHFLEIIQHDSAVNPGNSGGPLFDECGRVVGVNTYASGSGRITRDKKGEVVDVMAGIGVFFSSRISETTRELKKLGIQLEVETTPCVPNAEQVDLNKSMMKWMAVLAVVTLAALVFSLRKPRERIIEVVKTTNESISGLVSRAKVKKSLVIELDLSGTDSMGGGVRINIRSDQLTSGYGFSLGRHPELVDRSIDDATLSKRHCRFSWSGSHLFVEDLNSSNGTVVNGQQLEPFKKIKVRTGDSLFLGSMDLTIRLI